MRVLTERRRRVLNGPGDMTVRFAYDRRPSYAQLIGPELSYSFRCNPFGRCAQTRHWKRVGRERTASGALEAYTSAQFIGPPASGSGSIFVVF